ncbi:hypothetical protein BLD44_000265 [Mastigocladus laminosus UU774]|nr:hypothetical protein BLD44_000265 [Mastigocladus laminosus UU774]
MATIILKIALFGQWSMVNGQWSMVNIRSTLPISPFFLLFSLGCGKIKLNCLRVCNAACV